MNYFLPLTKAFEASANSGKALWMKAYLKDQFEFYGIDAKSRDSIVKNFFAECGYPSREDLFPTVFYLWNLPQREYQYAAIDLCLKFKKYYDKEDIRHIRQLIVTKSWWDSVDGIAAWICSSFFLLYPELVKPVTEEWVNSQNIWLQRSALLFQLKYKTKTDTALLSEYIHKLKTSNEFFIRKAIGWILREYSKSDPAWVREFITTPGLSGLSLREASKYLKD